MFRFVALFLSFLILVAFTLVAYFLWWDETHCVICRTKLDQFGGCVNPECHYLQPDEKKSDRLEV